MAQSPLRSRRDFLRDIQNADGGWGYFPGKRSRLEPTVYAALALKATEAATRTRTLLHSWALPQGGWCDGADIPGPSWASSLALTLYSINGWHDPELHRSILQLVRTVGAEGSFLMQWFSRRNRETNDLDHSVQGWPWRTGNTSWVEPTAHAIISLRNVTAFLGPRKTPNYLGLQRRIDVGERMLLERRAADGGWNCGNRRVYGIELPSYPETTAIALIALKGNPKLDLAASLQVASRYSRESRSPLALCWLRMAGDLYGFDAPAPAESDAKPSQDVMLAALQCLASEGSGKAFFHPSRSSEAA